MHYGISDICNKYTGFLDNFAQLDTYSKLWTLKTTSMYIHSLHVIWLHVDCDLETVHVHFGH